MEKAIEIGKTSAKGSLHLFLGVATSTIIMAVGTIILARLMTPEEYGLYSVALIPSYTAILFRDWGVNSALTKYTATLRAQNKKENTWEIIKAGILFETATGLTLTIILTLLSAYVAVIFQRPESAHLIAIASITIFSTALTTAVQSTFIGFEKMELNSLTLITQAIAKTIISPILVFMGLSALGAVIGYTASTIAATAIALTMLYLLLIRKLKTNENPHNQLAQTLKQMLRYGVPLSTSAILSGLLIQYYSFLMAIYCTDASIGNYQAATQFATLLTFITVPISTVLFPAFSKINPKEEGELLQTIFSSSVKYTSILLVPATMAIMVLSKPMISTLFGDKWVDAPFYLTLYVISNLFATIGSLSLGSFLSGIGETKTQMKLSLITLACGIPTASVLIPTMGIVGLITTNILAGLPSLSIGLSLIWKRYNVKADIKASIKTLAASTISAATALLIISLVSCVDWLELAAGGLMFAATYLILTPIVGVLNKGDINNLKTMFSGLGIISKILNVPLIAMEKLLMIL